MKLHRLAAVTILALFGHALGLDPVEANAQTIAFKAQLIWATDGPKPNDGDHSDIDEMLKEKLRKVFKWQNYFEINERKNREQFKVRESESIKRKLSSKCEIQIKNQGNSMIQVELFAEGNLVKTVRQTIAAQESLVLAGPDENDTAWFVILARR